MDPTKQFLSLIFTIKEAFLNDPSKNIFIFRKRKFMSQHGQINKLESTPPKKNITPNMGSRFHKVRGHLNVGSLTSMSITVRLPAERQFGKGAKIIMQARHPKRGTIWKGTKVLQVQTSSSLHELVFAMVSLSKWHIECLQYYDKQSTLKTNDCPLA